VLIYPSPIQFTQIIAQAIYRAWEIATPGPMFEYINKAVQPAQRSLLNYSANIGLLVVVAAFFSAQIVLKAAF
jgi:hypothetical protein